MADGTGVEGTKETSRDESTPAGEQPDAQF